MNNHHAAFWSASPSPQENRDSVCESEGESEDRDTENIFNTIIVIMKELQSYQRCVIEHSLEHCIVVEQFLCLLFTSLCVCVLCSMSCVCALV